MREQLSKNISPFPGGVLDPYDFDNATYRSNLLLFQFLIIYLFYFLGRIVVCPRISIFHLSLIPIFYYLLDRKLK